nr:MAG TPA: hypothetical protein [Caudoviricetes sp.]
MAVSSGTRYCCSGGLMRRLGDGQGVLVGA